MADAPKKNAALEALAARAKPLFEKAVALLNARNMREKVMIIVLAAAVILSLDYLVFIRPVIQVFEKTLPALAAEEGQLRALRMDRKNKSMIEKNLADTKSRLEAQEKTFIAPDQLPALLEDLSKLAQDSDVKILTLKPIEASAESPAAGKKSRYTSTPIQISAVAGTHELGKFLAKLESGTTFFRVLNLKITAGTADIRRHRIDMNLETYRLEPAK